MNDIRSYDVCSLIVTYIFFNTDAITFVFKQFQLHYSSNTIISS